MSVVVTIRVIAIKADRGDSGPYWKWHAALNRETLLKNLTAFDTVGEPEEREIFQVGGAWRIFDKGAEKPVEFFE